MNNVWMRFAAPLFIGVVATACQHGGNGQELGDTGMTETQLEKSPVSADYYSEQAAKDGRILAGREAGHPLNTGHLTLEQYAAEKAAASRVAAAPVEPVEPAVPPTTSGTTASTEPVGTPTSCGVRILEKSAAAVGDPCLTTVEFMRRDLNLSEKQIARVERMAGTVGVAH